MGGYSNHTHIGAVRLHHSVGLQGPHLVENDWGVGEEMLEKTTDNNVHCIQKLVGGSRKTVV